MESGDGAVLSYRVYKKKAEIIDLIDEFTAKVKLLDSNMMIKIDQVVVDCGCDGKDELQTTTPREGGVAIVVNGPLLGEHVRLRKLLREEDYCEVEIISGVHK